MRRYSPSSGAGERGPLAVYLDTGKAHAELDLDEAEGRASLREMVSRCDLLMHDLDQAQVDRIGLDALRATHPGLVEVALLPFGSEGPYAGQSTEFCRT